MIFFIAGIVRETLRRPIGPLIGFVCQYMIMPLIAFGLGYVFYDQPAMRLGLFVTGASPGGGASNIWTLMFGGNLNLSITMTAISTFAAFVMMPAWIFTLGRVIFSEGQLVIPFYKICTYAVCLVVPLGIGLAISKWCPKLSKVGYLVRFNVLNNSSSIILPLLLFNYFMLVMSLSCIPC